MTEKEQLLLYLGELEKMLVSISKLTKSQHDSSVGEVSPVTIQHLNAALAKVKTQTGSDLLNTFDIEDETPNSVLWLSPSELLPQVRLAKQLLEGAPD